MRLCIPVDDDQYFTDLDERCIILRCFIIAVMQALGVELLSVVMNVSHKNVAVFGMV